MTTDNSLPEWVRTVFEKLSATIELMPPDLEAAYAAPEETSLGLDILEIAPAVVELAEPGPHQGQHVFGMIQNFDLLAAQTVFDEVSALSFALENDGTPTISIEGQVAGHRLLTLIYAMPFEYADDQDDEAQEGAEQE